jgi:DNA-binding transcriptional ArsR family regulator
MKSSAPTLLPLLRSKAQGQLLAVILLRPAEEHSITELVELSGSSLATVVREVNSFEQAGLATSRRVGRNRLVRARRDGPLVRPLSELLAATFGPPAVLAEELTGIAGIDDAYLYGSWPHASTESAERHPTTST